MVWQKKGLIYAPSNDGSWRHQFAMLPTPLARSNGDLRLFLGFCDPSMVGRIGFVDVDADDPSKVIRLSESPVLDIGEPGAFDDNGVVPISLVQFENELRMYYIGFQLGVRVPYFMFCGLAASSDGGDTFTRVRQNPILDRNSLELYARCGCHVMWDQGRWRMWYVGSVGKGWVQRDGKTLPLYTVRHVESLDGIQWLPSVGQPCLEFQNDDEHGFGRPFVRKLDTGYEMLLSVRTFSRGYNLSRALSHDGIEWERCEDNIFVNSGNVSQWDAVNTSYAHTQTIKGRHFLFYNGNGCGRSGVGYAEWVDV